MINLADLLTESAVGTEGLIPGQTPMRDELLSKGGRKTSRFKDTVQGFPIDWKAHTEAPKNRKNFYYVNPDDVPKVIKKQWQNYFNNPTKYGLTENSTIKDAIEKFDAENPINKIKFMKEKGIDTNTTIKDAKKMFDLSMLNPFSVKEAEAGSLKRKIVDDEGFFNSKIEKMPGVLPKTNKIKVIDDIGYFGEKEEPNISGVEDKIFRAVLSKLSPQMGAAVSSFLAPTKGMFHKLLTGQEYLTEEDKRNIMEHPVTSAVGGVAGGVTAYAAAAATGVGLPLAFGALSGSSELADVIADKDKQDLNLAQKAGRVAVATGGGALVGKFFKDARLLKNAVKQVLKPAAQSGGLSSAEHLIKNGISGEDLDFKGALAGGAMNFATIGVLGLAVKLPIMNKLVLREAEAISGKKGLKVKEARKILNKAGIKEHELSPEWQKANQEVKTEAAIQDFQARLGLSEADAKFLMRQGNIKQKAQILENQIKKYSDSGNKEKASLLAKYKRMIVEDNVDPSNVFLADAVVKKLQTTTKVEQTVANTPEMKKQVIEAKEKVQKSTIDQSKKDRLIGELEKMLPKEKEAKKFPELPKEGSKEEADAIEEIVAEGQLAERGNVEYAFKLKDGTVVSDKDVNTHLALSEKESIDPDNVSQSGFISNGEFVTELQTDSKINIDKVAETQTIQDLKDISNFTSDAQKGGSLYEGEEGQLLRSPSGNLPSVQNVGGPKNAQKIIDTAIKKLELGKPISGSAQDILNEWRTLQSTEETIKETDVELEELKSQFPEITDEEITEIQEEIDGEDLWNEERLEEATKRYLAKKEGSAKSERESFETKGLVPRDWAEGVEDKVKRGIITREQANEMLKKVADQEPEKEDEEFDAFNEATRYIQSVFKKQEKVLSLEDMWKGYISTHSEENQILDYQFKLEYELQVLDFNREKTTEERVIAPEITPPIKSELFQEEGELFEGKEPAKSLLKERYNQLKSKEELADPTVLSSKKLKNYTLEELSDGTFRRVDNKTGEITVQPSTPLTKAMQKKTERERILGKMEDFGEKIGGARKDTAEKTGSRGIKKEVENKGETWRNKYIATQVVYEGKDKGRWKLSKKTKKRYSFGGSSETFSTQEEAEKSIPLYAVSDTHRVYQDRDNKEKYAVYKKVGERKLFKVVNKQFDSREEALKYMAENAIDIMNIKTTFGEEILPSPKVTVRKGLERRTENADSKMFMKTFAPRGIEFGNWNNSTERQEVLNHAYDGLLDLADILGVSAKDLMLNGELGIAFGARGQGLSGAKAHYEPEYGVINLTKMKGAGSLAHEWFHALDNHLARLDGKTPSERIKNKRGDMVFSVRSNSDSMLSFGKGLKSQLDKGLLETYKNLIDSMLKKAEIYVEDTKVADKFLSKAKENLKNDLDDIRKNLERDLTKEATWRKNKVGLKPASQEQLNEFDKIAKTLLEGGNLDLKWEVPQSTRSKYGYGTGRWTNETLESLSKLHKSIRNNIGFTKTGYGQLDKLSNSMRLYKQRLDMFKDAENKTEKSKSVPTNYAIEARKMDQARTGDYWSHPHEMAARAFASYTEDLVSAKGWQSDFMVYHAHGGIILPMIDGFVARPYPEGEERELINKEFDKFFSKVKGILKRDNDLGGATKFLDEKGQVLNPFEWEADIPVKTATDDAFQDHVDYFQNMQLSEDSKIRDIKKEMQKVNGQRLAMSISPTEANTKMARLRGDLIRTAQDEGISIFRTKKGQLKLGMREQSEVFVPEDFSEYKKFKDFEMRLGGIVDTARMLQEIDGSLSVKEKENIKGQAGPVERYIGWRTRDISIQKLNFNEQWSRKLNAIFKGIKPDSKEDRLLTQALNTGVEKGLNPILVMKSRALRKFYDELLDKQNVMRVLRGQEPIPFRRNYSPQMLAEAVVWSQLFNKSKESEEIQKDAFLPDYVMPNKPFNARELARKGDMPYELMLKSSYELAKRYLSTAQRDIFNTSIIQNNKAFISQLEALGYKKAADALAKWNAEGYAGVKAGIDRVINLPEGINKTLRYTNAIRNLAVFPFRLAFNTGNQIKSLSFTIGRYGYTDTFNGLLQYMNPKNRQQLRDIYSFRVKSAKAGRVSKQDNNNTLDGIIDDKLSPVERWNNVGTFILEELEKTLTGASVFASYNVGKKRGLKGESLNQFASDGGGKTQSMYNNEDRPGILRNLIIKSIAPYQTFKFEMVNSIRELAGKTGTPPDDKREATAMFLRFVSAAILMRLIADFASKKDMREIINPLPFAQWTTDPIIDKAIGTSSYGQNESLPSFTGMAVELTDGVARSVKGGSVNPLDPANRKLRNTFIKYTPGLFGVGGGMAAERVVDTLIAHSQGGIYSAKGELQFRVESEDIARGIYSGVWTTRGGEEYKEKKFVQPKFLRELPFRYGIFGKKKVYPTTRKEWKRLPDSMRQGTEKNPAVLLKTEKRPRRVIYIDTPPGRHEMQQLIKQDKSTNSSKKLSPKEVQEMLDRAKKKR